MGFKRQKQRLSEHAHVTSDAHGLVHRGHEEQCDMRRAEKLEILHDSEVALFSGVARDSRRLVIGCSLLLPALGVNAVGAVEIERKIPREVLLARRFQKCGAQLVERLPGRDVKRSEEHTSELQSLMRISYAVFCLKKKNQQVKR